MRAGGVGKCVRVESGLGGGKYGSEEDLRFMQLTSCFLRCVLSDRNGFAYPSHSSHDPLGISKPVVLAPEVGVGGGIIVVVVVVVVVGVCRVVVDA